MGAADRASVLRKPTLCVGPELMVMSGRMVAIKTETSEWTQVKLGRRLSDVEKEHRREQE